MWHWFDYQLGKNFGQCTGSVSTHHREKLGIIFSGNFGLESNNGGVQRVDHNDNIRGRLGSSEWIERATSTSIPLLGTK